MEGTMCDQDHCEEDRREYETRGLVTRVSSLASCWEPALARCHPSATCHGLVHGRNAYLAMGARYPEMMDSSFPIGSLPIETGGRNRLWRHTIVGAIRNDPEWKSGEQQPRDYSRIAHQGARPAKGTLARSAA